MKNENRKVIIRQFKLNKNKKIHKATALHYRSLSQKSSPKTIDHFHKNLRQKT